MDLEQMSVLLLTQQSEVEHTENAPEISLFGKISLLSKRKPTKIPAQIPLKPPKKRVRKPIRLFLRPSFQEKIKLQNREPPLQRTSSVLIRNLLGEKYRYDTIRLPTLPKLVQIKHRHTQSLGQLPTLKPLNCT